MGSARSGDGGHDRGWFGDFDLVAASAGTSTARVIANFVPMRSWGARMAAIPLMRNDTYHIGRAALELDGTQLDKGTRKSRN
jgi:hypothetical protein